MADQTYLLDADALLAAYAANRNIPPASFDRDLDRFADIQRFEP